MCTTPILFRYWNRKSLHHNDSHSVFLPAKSFFLSRTTIPDGLGKDAMCENKWFGHKFELEADIMPTRQKGRLVVLFPFATHQRLLPKILTYKPQETMKM